MKLKSMIGAVMAGTLCCCTPTAERQPQLPSWNDTPVKESLVNYLTTKVDQIPVEDRIAVFDMDGTLVCERPFGIETVVSVYKLLEMGEKDLTIKESIEYQYAQKLSVNPRDTSVWNHPVVNGEYVLANIIQKPFDGADSEEYITFARQCLETEVNQDYHLTYADMFYQPMLELMQAFQEKQFQIYIVSASMQGIVWSICPQTLGIDRSHLMGIRHPKTVSFPKEGPVKYTIQAGMISPTNNYKGKAINIYNQIGKTPVVAVGNTYSDFGMFHMASCSPYPNLSLLLNHDDEKREYVYTPTHGRPMNWQDSLRLNGWLQADMSKEFKIVWKKK